MHECQPARPMASIKAHLGCNDTRCTRTPRASVSSDWWKPRRQETGIKSTNLPGSRLIRFEKGGGASRGSAISRCPPSCPANRRASVHRSSHATRREESQQAHRIAPVVVMMMVVVDIVGGELMRLAVEGMGEGSCTLQRCTLDADRGSAGRK